MKGFAVFSDGKFVAFSISYRLAHIIASETTGIEVKVKPWIIIRGEEM